MQQQEAAAAGLCFKTVSGMKGNGAALNNNVCHQTDLSVTEGKDAFHDHGVGYSTAGAEQPSTFATAAATSVNIKWIPQGWLIASWDQVQLAPSLQPAQPSGLSTKLMPREDSGKLGCMAGNNDKAEGQTDRCVVMCLRCCCCKCRPDHNNRFHLWRWRAAMAADGV